MADAQRPESVEASAELAGRVDLAALDPAFVANASVDAIRAQYERAQRMADVWDDRARALFLLLCERDEEAAK